MTVDARRPSDDDLVTENATLRRRVAEREQRVAALEVALQTALDQLDAARRAGTWQATPFSKGPPKENPQRPGPKAGHPAAHRQQPERVDRTLAGTLAHTTCPPCERHLIELLVGLTRRRRGSQWHPGREIRSGGRS
jgi:hypothetical protein